MKLKILLSLLTITIFTSLVATEPVFKITRQNVNQVKAARLKSDKESVVCLHAFMRPYHSLKPIANSLEHQGFDVFIWNYESRKFTLAEHATHLIVILQKIAQEKPGQAINFVTHSIGGVILRVALDNPDCPQEAKIGRAVLMAPPNAGSALARKYQKNPFVRFVFGDKLGRQLLEYNEETMLNAGFFPSTVDVLVLSGCRKSRMILFKIEEPNDGKVKIRETILKTPYAHYTIYTDHTYIVYHKDSIFLISKFLNKESVDSETLPSHSCPCSCLRHEHVNVFKRIEPAKEKKLKFKKLAKQKQNLFIIHSLSSRPTEVIGFPKNK